jgi:hypothetical protein
VVRTRENGEARPEHPEEEEEEDSRSFEGKPPPQAGAKPVQSVRESSKGRAAFLLVSSRRFRLPG